MSAHVYTLALITQDGKRHILLVNKRNRPFEISIEGASGGQIDYVDQSTGFKPPARAHLAGDSIKLEGLSVSIVTLP
jgi:hypothetical protein